MEEIQKPLSFEDLHVGRKVKITGERVEKYKLGFLPDWEIVKIEGRSVTLKCRVDDPNTDYDRIMNGPGPNIITLTEVVEF
jgi:hypothetical protein